MTNLYINILIKTPVASPILAEPVKNQDKMSIDQKVIRRQKLRWRIRAKVAGTARKPRLSVFRSNKDIYAQLIDDATGTTLAAANSRQKDIAAQKTNKVEKSVMVGKALAQKAIALGIETCVFDRGGYLYHGRVKAISDGAREGGLKF
jgi:large subunit ribosomal protein L18